jgi:hypothetical protein
MWYIIIGNILVLHSSKSKIYSFFKIDFGFEKKKYLKKIHRKLKVCTTNHCFTGETGRWIDTYNTMKYFVKESVF